jgi:hypothetical protein
LSMNRKAAMTAANTPSEENGFVLSDTVCANDSDASPTETAKVAGIKLVGMVETPTRRRLACLDWDGDVTAGGCWRTGLVQNEVLRGIWVNVVVGWPVIETSVAIVRVGLGGSCQLN